MTERIARRPDDGVRRFLEDLRSGFDRRSGLQRRRHRLIGDLGFDGSDRRDPRTDRRAGPYERRQPPAGGFERAERESLAVLLANQALPAVCPRCDGQLLLSEYRHAGRGVAVIHCTSCRRRAEMP